LVIAFWFHCVALVTSAAPLALGVPEVSSAQVAGRRRLVFDTNQTRSCDTDAWLAQVAVLPSAPEWLMLLGVGCCSFLGQLLLNRGFQLKTAAVASTISYTQVIW
jgi:hypothetical protein